MNIGIVNDLEICIKSLQQVLTSTTEHKVVWVARNGQEAIDCCKELTPDIILMDLIMPVMNGVEATRNIMQSTPCPILIVTSTVSGNSAKVFEAMSAGALDAVATPVVDQKEKNGIGKELLKKIHQIDQLTGSLQKKTEKARPIEKPKVQIEGTDLVVLGCSTGGPNILVDILSALSETIPASIIIVQHMDQQFTPGLVQWIDSKIKLQVRIARQGDIPEPGKVFIACTDDHLVMTPTLTLAYTKEPEDNFYHPSVDVFFSSIAQWWPGEGVAGLLTGMGRDGAEGLLALHNRNWYTIAQDRDSSVVYGMPKAAAELGAVTDILPANRIGRAINEYIFAKQSKKQ